MSDAAKFEDKPEDVRAMSLKNMDLFGKFWLTEMLEDAGGQVRVIWGEVR